MSAAGDGQQGLEAPWQSNLANPSQRVAALLHSSNLSDLTITLPSTHTSIKAHRLVLAMSSPVFEAMLFGPLAEGPELVLPDDPPEALQWLLEYMYSGNTKMPDVLLTSDVYQLAHKYQMKPLMTRCSEHLRAKLTANNLHEVYEMAVLLEDTRILEICSNIIKTSSAKVLGSSDLCKLSRLAFTHLLNSPLSIHSEVILLQAILRWGRAQDTCKELREEIEEFLPQVRFLTLSTDEFVEHVMPTGVLSHSEMTALLMNIKQLQGVPLPSLCSPEREKRLCYDETLLLCLTLTLPASGPPLPMQLNMFPRDSEGYAFSMHSDPEEYVVVTDLRTSTSLELACVEYFINNCLSDTPTIKIKNSEGLVLATATGKGRKVRFPDPVHLRAGTSYSFTIMPVHSMMLKNWVLKNGETRKGEVHLTARVACPKGGSCSITLYFWHFD